MIAALILAQLMAMVRRWGIFWGVIQPVEGEDAETIFQRLGAWLRRPRVRAAIFGIAAVELAALGSWVYFAHGTHLYQLGDQLAGQMRGETIVYSQVCGRDGRDHTVRIVLNRAGPGGAGIS